MIFFILGFLDSVEVQLIPSDASLHMLQKDIPKRLVLVNKKSKTKRPSRLNTKPINQASKASDLTPKLKNCGKSKSLDSSDIFYSNDISINTIAAKKNLKNTPDKEKEVMLDSQTTIMGIIAENPINSKKSNKASRRDLFCSPLMRRRKPDEDKVRGRTNTKKTSPIPQFDQNNDKNGVSIHTQALANLEKLITKLKEDDCKPSKADTTRLPKSQPSSPAPSKKGTFSYECNWKNLNRFLSGVRPQSASPIRRKLLNSPLLGRRNRKKIIQESSDDEVNASGDEVYNGSNYKDLETFQKSQLRQKVSERTNSIY